MTATLHLKSHPALRVLLALALLAGLAFAAFRHGVWLPVVIGMVAPDIALAFGMDRGRLNPRGVPLYNLLHSFWLPLTLTAVAATGALAPAWFVLGLAWTTHIAVDRAAGYGLRDREGFQRGG